MAGFVYRYGLGCAWLISSASVNRPFFSRISNITESVHCIADPRKMARGKSPFLLASFAEKR